MPELQAQMLEKLRSMEEAITSSWYSYWFQHSNMGTWQFWIRGDESQRIRK